MAVFVAGYDFVSLYGTDGLGWLVGIRDNTTDATGRKNAVNWANAQLAGIKGYWRRRSNDYTSSSSPALADGTRAYNLPSDYNDPYRLYYRVSGRYRDVPILGDEEWLQRSATASSDKNYPQFCRIIHNGTNFQIELNRPMSQSFINTFGTLTLEYGVRVPLLSADTDTSILPNDLRLNILPVAAWWYAVTQGDHALANQLKPESEKAKAAVLKHDLTRTGRPRQLRTSGGYEPDSSRGMNTAGVKGGDDYGDNR